MAAVEVGQEDEVQLCVECGGRGVAFVDGWAAWTDDEQPVECPVCIENLICPQCSGSMVNVCDGCGKEPEWCECDDPEYSNYEKDLRCLVCGLLWDQETVSAQIMALEAGDDLVRFRDRPRRGGEGPCLAGQAVAVHRLSGVDVTSAVHKFRHGG